MGPGSYRPVTGTFRGIMNRPFLRIAAACALSAALFGCANEPPKHLRPLSYQMQVEMKLKSLELDAPILLRIYKQESELEVWKRGPSGQFALLKTFPICKWSGGLGPKLKEGDRAEVTLILKPRPAEAPDPAPSDPIAPPASDPEQDAAHDPTLTWVALGVGAAGILVGGVTGLIAAQKESQLAEDCPNGKCPPTSDADLANTKTFALASTIGFAVGVVGLGVGGYLWFFEAGDSGGATTARHGPRVGAFIGVSRVGLTGEF